MSILDQLTNRLEAKKSASRSPLEKLGESIYKGAMGNTTATFKKLVAKAEDCPLCGSDLSMFNPSNIKKAEGCPTCGSIATKPKAKPSAKPDAMAPEGDAPVVPTNGKGGVVATDNAKKPQTMPPAGGADPATDPAVDPAADPTQGGDVTPKPPKGQAGGFLNMPDEDPTPKTEYTGSDAVQNIGSALGHRVEVNSDAHGMGVTHAGMMVHPEWNQDGVSKKIAGHLGGKGWKTSSKMTKVTTHESPDGHKVHVAQVGHHMVISGQDKEGTTPKAVRQAAPEVDAKGKPIQKPNPFGGVQKEELVQKDWATYDAKHGGHQPAQYSSKHPKIDLHHKDTGAYLGSTNWSPTVEHAVANYADKNPHLNGLVKGVKVKKEEAVDSDISTVEFVDEQSKDYPTVDITKVIKSALDKAISDFSAK